MADKLAAAKTFLAHAREKNGNTGTARKHIKSSLFPKFLDSEKDCGAFTECPSGNARGRMAVLRSEGLRLSLGRSNIQLLLFASLDLVRLDS